MDLSSENLKELIGYSSAVSNPVKQLAQEVLNLRSELEQDIQARRKLSGIVKHWQEFAERLADALHCSTVTDDIEIALEQAKARERRLVEVLNADLLAEYEKEIANDAT